MAVAVTVRMCVRVRVRVTIAAALVGSVANFDVPGSHGYRPAGHRCRAWAGRDPWPVSRDPVSPVEVGVIQCLPRIVHVAVKTRLNFDRQGLSL